MSTHPQPRLSVSATPEPRDPDRSGTGWYSSTRSQLPRAGNDDQSAAARRERVAASVSPDTSLMIHDGNHSEGFTYDRRGRLVFTDPDGEATLVITGQGTSRNEYREPVAADAVQSAAGWYALIYAALLVLLGIVLGVVLT
jgi:hypothetical protein